VSIALRRSPTCGAQPGFARSLAVNRTLAAFLAAIALVACAQSPSPAPQEDPSSLPTLTPLYEDCDFTAPLVPGIPGSPGHPIKSSRNPNGDSELSYVMRQMADDLAAARSAMQSGGVPKTLLPIHRRIRCSWASKPEERNETFDGMAKAYLASVKAFDEAPSKQAYNAMVQGCVSCHSMTCRGPIDMIEQLIWR